MNVEREHEVKLEVDDAFELGDLTGVVAGAALAEVVDRHLVATYFDTADLRLARWGCTVRERNDAGWVVKLPVPDVPSSAGDVVLRDEVHVEADGGSPPAAAADLVGALRRGAPLVPIATMTTDRQAHVFTRAGGEVVAELVDDRVEVVEASGAVRRFREVEIELLAPDGADVLDALRDHVVMAGGRSAPAMSKLVRGLGDRATGPPDVDIPAVSEWPTGREVTHAAVAGAIAHLVLHLPHARLSAEVSVHQARVAVRRLRSDLKTFRDLVDPNWAERIQPELRWLGAQLGHVRDDDVLLIKLASLDEAAPLLPIFEREREVHRADLLRALDDERAIELLDELVAAAHDPPTTPQADDPAEELLRPIVRKRWRQLRREVDGLGGDPAEAELHGVRIVAKRCRYAIEAVTPAFGADARACAKALARLQDSLGDLNDAAVISARLGDTAAFTPAEAFAAGRVVGRLGARAEAEREAWRPEWKQLAHPRRWRWL